MYFTSIGFVHVSGSACYSHVCVSSSGCQHAAKELLPVPAGHFPREPPEQVSRAEKDVEGSKVIIFPKCDLPRSGLILCLEVL